MLPYFIFSCLVGYVFWVWYNESNDLANIKKYGSITIGTITKHYIVFPESHYIEYSYSVNGNQFIKKENNSNISKYCKGDPAGCLGKHFGVRYSNSMPKNAYIILDSLLTE